MRGGCRGSQQNHSHPATRLPHRTLNRTQAPATQMRPPHRLPRLHRWPSSWRQPRHPNSLLQWQLVSCDGQIHWRGRCGLLLRGAGCTTGEAELIGGLGPTLRLFQHSKAHNGWHVHQASNADSGHGSGVGENRTTSVRAPGLSLPYFQRPPPAACSRSVCTNGVTYKHADNTIAWRARGVAAARPPELRTPQHVSITARTVWSSAEARSCTTTSSGSKGAGSCAAGGSGGCLTRRGGGRQRRYSADACMHQEQQPWLECSPTVFSMEAKCAG